MNLYPVTIVNDFYENPDEIRSYALAQDYRYCNASQDSYGWPGSRTKEISELNQELYKKICLKLVSLFHNSEHDIMRWNILTGFQIVEQRYGNGLIHQDGDVIFAGIIYLTPNAPLNSGTSIYRKNERFDDKRYCDAMNQNDLMLKNGKMPSFDYHNMFDETVRVNNVYNTLILFEGDQYHSANQFFGATKEDSRLTQVFFIKRVDAQKHSVFPINRIKSINL